MLQLYHREVAHQENACVPPFRVAPPPPTGDNVNSIPQGNLVEDN